MKSVSVYIFSFLLIQMDDIIYIIITILFFIGLILYQYKTKIIHKIEYLAWKTTDDSEYALI